LALPLDILKILHVDILNNLPDDIRRLLPLEVRRQLSLANIKKLPVGVRYLMDPSELSVLPLSEPTKVLQKYPHLYPHFPIEILRRLVDAGEVLETLPSEPLAGISKLVECHLVAAAAIKSHESPSTNTPTPEPTDRHRTSLSPPPGRPGANSRAVDSKTQSRLEEVQRERDELRAEVARLDAEKRSFSKTIRQLLTRSKSDDWQPDGNPYDQILEFTSSLQDRIEFTSQEMDTFIKTNNEGEHQRAILEKTVRKLKARLVEQTDSMAATENQTRLQAENTRLQHLVEARAKEYQEMRRSLEERHSATSTRQR
jgi:hypothetical protein